MEGLPQDIIDRLELRVLIDEYALAVDERSADRFAGVFPPEGVLAIIEPGDTEPAVAYRGICA